MRHDWPEHLIRSPWNFLGRFPHPGPWMAFVPRTVFRLEHTTLREAETRRVCCKPTGQRRICSGFGRTRCYSLVVTYGIAGPRLVLRRLFLSRDHMEEAPVMAF